MAEGAIRLAGSSGRDAEGNAAETAAPPGVLVGGTVRVLAGLMRASGEIWLASWGWTEAEVGMRHLVDRKLRKFERHFRIFP